MSTDQIELVPNASNVESGKSNFALQLAITTIENPGFVAWKTFSVTSGILSKGILINNNVQREFRMISKNH